MISLAALSVAHGMSFAQETAEDNWRPLFDGKSLEGWTTSGGDPVARGWLVDDGLLHRASRGGAIYSADEYSDFELRFTWKIARRGNAGVKYRVQFYQQGVFGNPGHLGYEYQLLDDGDRRDTAGSTGALYALVAPPADKPLRAVGEWNDSRIVAADTHLEHWLNGERIVQIDTAGDDWKKRIAKSKFGPVEGFASVRSGRIQLQDHGHPVWFKRIEIREIDTEQ